MKKSKKTFTKGISLALALAMTAGSMAPYVQAAGNVRADETPKPLFHFDMESLENGKIINTATGEEYALGGNAGALVNSAGANGKALKFDGTNYVDLGTEFQLTNAYTLTGWVKQDAGATDGQAIVARAWSGNVEDQLAVMVKNNGVYHSMSVGNGNRDFNEFITGSVTEAEEWEHIAVTRDENNVKVYVNGELVTEKTNFPADDFAEASKKMYIGMDCDGSGSLYSRHAFKGALDEIRLYDTALTEEQVQELAHVEASYSVSEFVNGKVEVKLADYVTEAPVQDDFKLKFFVDDKEVTKEVTAYEYRESDKTAVFTFDAFENMTSAEKAVKVRVEYKGVAQESEFALPAGENKAPEVKDISIINRSTELLGEEPHVKGMLQAEYTFSDAENDVEGETKYQWYISDTPDGEYTKLPGIRTKSIILLHQYVGKYLKCEITPADVNGNIGEAVMSPATTQAVMDTEGNPLTDWFYEAKFGLSHHFLSNYFNLGHVYTSPEEMWDRKAMTWDEFVGQFDAEAYAEQINAIGAKFVIITLGQNSGSYCAPNAVYDKYMREAGFIKEGEQNPKTTSMENDLPMKMANALEKYGIKVMLYLPSNPPHSASWDETGTPNEYGYFSDYLVTKNVFDYTPGWDGNPSQKARKVLSEMVTWWSEHYGDKIAGWWFDGFYHSGAGSQFDMSLEYNISTLANAAKAGNPYNIVAFNKGINNFQKMTDYTDYTAGECTGLDAYPNSGRWTTNFYNQTSESERKADCQNFMFGPLGSRASWSNGWGCGGINHTDVSEVTNAVDTAISRDCVIGLDTRVNVHGQIDKAQYEQLKEVKKSMSGEGETELVLNKEELTLEAAGDRGLVKFSGVKAANVEVVSSNPEVAEVMAGSGSTYNVIAKGKGTATLTFVSSKNPDLKATCEVTVNGREAKEVYDDTADVFAYSSGWGSAGNRPLDSDGFHEYKDTVHYATSNGASVTLTFNGTGFDWIGGYNSDQGRVSVQVDDEEAVIIDTSVPNGGEKKAFGLNLYGRYDLADGEHKVTFTKLDGQYFVFDGARVYQKTAAYTVNVLNGEGSGDFNYNDKVTVTAEAEKDGMQFVGWKADDMIVSTEREYTFYVSGDVTLEAVYGEEVTQAAEALLSNVIAAKRPEDGKYDVKFVGQLVLPAGYKVQEAGLVWSSKEDVTLDMDTAAAKKTYIKRISDTNQFSVTIKGMPAGNSIRGKIFAKVIDDQGQVQNYIYSIDEGRFDAK